jgi:hypothetical protein
MNVTFTDEELTRIRRAHNIEEKDEGYHIHSSLDCCSNVILFNSTTRSSPASSASCAVAHKSLDFMPWKRV